MKMKPVYMRCRCGETVEIKKITAVPVEVLCQKCATLKNVKIRRHVERARSNTGNLSLRGGIRI